MRLVLASESPRRRELLKLLVSEFDAVSSDARELTLAECRSPEELVKNNAWRKAQAVADDFPEAWVLGADTVIEYNNLVYGKPRDLAEAAQFLRTFSGREHKVLTGVALINAAGKKSDCFVAESKVRFRTLNDDLIDEYLSLVPVLDKAGAYGIQDHGEMLVESVDGELENIIGLPVAALAVRLNHWGIKTPEYPAGARG